MSLPLNAPIRSAASNENERRGVGLAELQAIGAEFDANCPCINAGRNTYAPGPTDLDGDGHNTWQKWRCLTDPTNALSALRLLSASPAGTNVTVSWQSVAGVNYFLECSTNL